MYLPNFGQKPGSRVWGAFCIPLVLLILVFTGGISAEPPSSSGTDESANSQEDPSREEQQSSENEDPNREGPKSQNPSDSGEGSDEVIMVPGDDPEMNAAIQEARDTLPEFWTKFANPEPGEDSFMIKVMISDSKGIEHFWCGRLKKEGESIQCTITNEPQTVESVEFGQLIEPDPADISDWMYRKNGYIYGNRTMRVLIKRMPKEKADYYRSMLADP